MNKLLLDKESHSSRAIPSTFSSGSHGLGHIASPSEDSRRESLQPSLVSPEEHILLIQGEDSVPPENFDSQYCEAILSGQITSTSFIDEGPKYQSFLRAAQYLGVKTASFVLFTHPTSRWERLIDQAPNFRATKHLTASVIIPTEVASFNKVDQKALEAARQALAQAIMPIQERMNSRGMATLWVPHSDTLAGPFTDGLLEAFLSSIQAKWPVGYHQHKGDKTLYFLSPELRDRFVEAVGASKLVKVGSAHRLFRVTQVSEASCGVTFIIMGVPLNATSEEVETILSLVASLNKKKL